jgi:TatD DNase family protein
VWIDQHCHLDDESADEEVAAARRAGVDRIIDIGTDVDTSSAAIARAGRLDGVWATVGLHPHDARHGLDGLEPMLGAPGVVAVGECGLDYHYDHSPRPLQRDAFATQVEWAHRHHLPLVIHSRSAWDDTFAVLDEAGVPDRTVFHCFTGGPAEARQALDRGAYLSFSGIVTFPKAPEVREAAAVCPDDRLLVETDSPFLAPVPHRGRRNRPAWVVHVGERLAEVRGVPTSAIAEITTANGRAVYGI